MLKAMPLQGYLKRKIVDLIVFIMKVTVAIGKNISFTTGDPRPNLYFVEVMNHPQFQIPNKNPNIVHVIRYHRANL